MVLIPPFLFLGLRLEASPETDSRQEGLDVPGQLGAARRVVDGRIAPAILGYSNAAIRGPEMTEEPPYDVLGLLEEPGGQALFIGAHPPDSQPVEPLRHRAPPAVSVAPGGGQVDLEPGSLRID